MTRHLRVLAFLACLSTVWGLAHGQTKSASVLYPAEVVARVRENIANDPWAASVKTGIVEMAEFWRAKTDNELWNLMFGPAINRSWMVWSNGYSPATGQPVPMYNWIMKAQEHPWKVECPHSGELFPKNDFKAFYDSGLNERGVFDPQLADRALLFNAEHPDPNDPLHLYGVDDGNGYVNEKGERWRFIGAYLIYGQWKQLVLGGIRALSAAYVVTGEPEYAHKAGVMLDRVADLYPDFDFKAQGVMYEGPASAGYVSTWHDTCEETRELAMSYDMIFEALREDTALPAFLAQQATTYGLANPKATFADVQRNIEERILRDALANPGKIYSNYPRTEVLKAVMTAVLQEPDEAFWAIVDPMLAKATAVDGVTGEKGLAGYASFTISALAHFLAEFDKADPTFTKRILERTPSLKQTYLFHIDTLCLQRYYPLSGDAGHFAAPVDEYVGVNFIKPGGNVSNVGGWTILAPSINRFLWSLYETTGDPRYVQVLYKENGYKLDGLPYDIYGSDPQTFQSQVASVIRSEGTLIVNPSVNKEAWHLGILRSGAGLNARALWLDYDSGGGHGHFDSMNLGLFAFGLDLLPEFGYPPVQFGGWESPRSRWYQMTASHNTVVVDGANQPKGSGTTTLWADGVGFRAIRAAAPETNNGNRYERTAVMVDAGPEHFYVVDVFRVGGGKDHTKFIHSHYGQLSTSGLELAEAGEYGNNTQMRNFRMAANAQPGWSANWTVEDVYNLLPFPRAIGMRYWDFTTDASAGTAEAWVVAGGYESDNEHWIPRVFVRRQADSEEVLQSTFAAVMEPYATAGVVESVERIEITDSNGNAMGDSSVALKIRMVSGETDLMLIVDPELERDSRMVNADGTQTDANLAWVRRDAAGTVVQAALCHGSCMQVGTFELKGESGQDFMEYRQE